MRGVHRVAPDVHEFKNRLEEHRAIDQVSLVRVREPVLARDANELVVVSVRVRER